MTIVDIKACRCSRCQHIWLPRTSMDKELPTVCPKCKSPYWNKEKEK